MFSILWMLFIGLIVGALAKLIFPGKQNMGWIATIALGVGGSFLAGWVASLLGQGDGSRAGIIGSLIGALLLIWIYERFVQKK